MKLGQVIEYQKRKIFLQKPCKEWGRVSNSRPLFVFLKGFKWGKSKWSAALHSTYFDGAQLGIQ